MKNTILLLILVIFSFWNTFADMVKDDSIIDNSIIDKLEKTEVKELNFDFSLKSFESCEGLKNVMEKYVKDYWKNNKGKWAYPVLYRTMWWPQIDIAMDNAVMEKSESAVSNNTDWVWGWSDDFSKTNTQVDGVDESDIVKTDWEYIYYYNQTDKFVYIVKAEELEIVKKIKLPSNFYNPVLYIWKNRLTIISSGYSNVKYSPYDYWINRNSKTYTIVFDTTNIERPVLTKLYVAEWDLRKSRKIGDLIYVVSNNSFAIPYRNFKNIDDIKIDLKKILPKKIDISKVNDKSKQNLKLRGRNLPYNITAGNIAKCNEIEYVLPDADTMKKFDFSPSYNIISIIDTKNTTNEVKTKVIAGSNAELYMSLDNMYLTSNIYQSYDFSCPRWAYCIFPWYQRWTNTLVHKINIDWTSLKYQDSTIVPWNPLTQYSMDEHKWNFRILTQTNNWNRSGSELHTDLYILDKDLKLKWSLKNIWSGEQFKSNRYIWDKLFLTTFKQVDPLFAIDVADPANPKVLWELKIPGYSTYLHPYDENHLIGLWYDTKENKWWGTINNGIKIDLYEINYDKKCWDSNLTVTEQEKCDSWDYKWILVKQKYSKTFWENGSTSEALSNPRMFMWKAEDNKLFLPVTLFKNDSIDTYRHIDFFQWLVVMSIDKNAWIKEDFRLTHIDYSWIDDERKKECSKYIAKNNKPKCVKLINWSEYCEPVSRNYVPKYCYADSTVWEYLASRSWNYRKSYVKRALWIGNHTYSISDDKMMSSNIDTGIKTDSVNMIK